MLGAFGDGGAADDIQIHIPGCIAAGLSNDVVISLVF